MLSATAPRRHAPDVQTKRALQTCHRQTGIKDLQQRPDEATHELRLPLHCEPAFVDPSALALVQRRVRRQHDQDVLQLCVERGIGSTHVRLELERPVAIPGWLPLNSLEPQLLPVVSGGPCRWWVSSLLTPHQVPLASTQLDHTKRRPR